MKPEASIGSLAMGLWKSSFCCPCLCRGLYHVLFNRNEAPGKQLKLEQHQAAPHTQRGSCRCHGPLFRRQYVTAAYLRVCIHIYIYTYVHTRGLELLIPPYIYIYLYFICTYRFTHVCIHASIHVCIYIYIYSCMNTHLYNVFQDRSPRWYEVIAKPDRPPEPLWRPQCSLPLTNLYMRIDLSVEVSIYPSLCQIKKESR